MIGTGLCDYYIDGVTRNVNSWVLGKGLEQQLSPNGGRFEINQLFSDDTALVADLEEKLCRLVSEFGTLSKKKVVC